MDQFWMLMDFVILFFIYVVQDFGKQRWFLHFLLMIFLGTLIEIDILEHVIFLFGLFGAKKLRRRNGQLVIFIIHKQK